MPVVASARRLKARAHEEEGEEEDTPSDRAEARVSELFESEAP